MQDNIRGVPTLDKAALQGDLEGMTQMIQENLNLVKIPRTRKIEMKKRKDAKQLPRKH